METRVFLFLLLVITSNYEKHKFTNIRYNQDKSYKAYLRLKYLTIKKESWQRI